MKVKNLRRFNCHLSYIFGEEENLQGHEGEYDEERISSGRTVCVIDGRSSVCGIVSECLLLQMERRKTNGRVCGESPHYGAREHRW